MLFTRSETLVESKRVNDCVRGHLGSFTEEIPQIGRTGLGGNGLARINMEGTVDRGKSPVPRLAGMKQDDVFRNHIRQSMCRRQGSSN